MSLRPELILQAEEYCKRTVLVIGQQLGAGVHGIVLEVESQSKSGRSAIKIHEREPYYRTERDVYRRLQEHGVTEIRGCAVPEMLGFDNELFVIEMTVVSRPFVLDFAGAYLDEVPDFSEEVMAEWRAEKMEQFEERWPEVQAILRDLESYGIFMIDVSPGNISFGD